MSWTAPPTFVSGAVLTAAQMNILGGDLSFLAGTQGATVATAQTTASPTYVDLATVGPAVTVTTGTKALVVVTANVANTAAAVFTCMSWAVTGATTAAAADSISLLSNLGASQSEAASAVYLQTGLTAGSNTFTAKYRVGGGTGQWSNRNIAVIPLP